ncbi:carboxypeptidase regulatory-like domain-containing protein [Candidatus Bathyarchaeota archaeon]|nr:carboxypeptidase regulatory-like domain-containing protein [Candidatus Bathyarchaeota archaeon]
MPILNVRLVDAETGAPIRYTPVWLNSFQSSTDQNGHARFDIPPGTYTLKVRSPLYEPYTAPATVPGTVTVTLRRILL